MPAKVTDEIKALAKNYSSVIDISNKKIGVFYYSVNDDTIAAACAIANALDADCIPISKRTDDKDNIFIFSRISRYDILIFGTPLINNRVPETFERFIVTTKANITCKSFHLFVTATKAPANPFKELLALFASIKSTMPVHPTSTVLIDSKTVDRFVGKALLCVSSELSYQEIMNVLGFHLYHHKHRHGCSHLATCKHRHCKHQASEKKKSPKAPKKAAEEKATNTNQKEEETKSASSEASPKSEKEEKSSSEESSTEESKDKASTSTSKSKGSTDDTSSDNE